MLPVKLPLLPFSHTTLPKKEWKDDKQEKKGRVIDLGDVLRSFDDKALAEYESDGSDVSSVPTEFYMSDDSSDDEERWKEKYYEDDGGTGMYIYIYVCVCMYACMCAYMCA